MTRVGREPVTVERMQRRIVTLVVTATLVAGCSGGGDTPDPTVGATASPSTTTTTTISPSASTAAPSSSPAPTTPSTLVLDESLGDLSAVAAAFYGGAEMRLDAAVSTAVAAPVRQAAVDTKRTVTGAVGNWEGTHVGVMVAGKDVTLLVKDPEGWTVVGGWWPSLGAPTPLPNDQRSVVLMGADARQGESVLDTRADAIQVVTTDGKGKAAVVGIARDTFVNIPGFGNAKINWGLWKGGPDMAMGAYRSFTGLELDGYVLTGFWGFTTMITDIGGLPIVLDAPKVADEVRLPAGEQTLTGPNALRYARERKAYRNGDFARTRHQGDMVVAAAGMLQSMGPTKLPQLLSVLSRRSETNLDARAAIVFFSRALTTKPSAVRQAVSGGSDEVRSNGEWIIRAGSRERALWADLKDGSLSKDY